MLKIIVKINSTTTIWCCQIKNKLKRLLIYFTYKMPRHRGLGEERTTHYFTFFRKGRKIETRRQLETGHHRIKIETQKTNWKQNKQTSAHPWTAIWRAGGRSKMDSIWRKNLDSTQLDPKLLRRKNNEKETLFFEGCGLRKREQQKKRGEKDSHEAFQEKELQQATSPVRALLH